MRLERLNYDKIKIFLTLDDLLDRGLTKEDLWRNSLKVQQLFRDMIEQASEELDFKPTQFLSVEVFSLQAQGMVVIVTTRDEVYEDDLEDDYANDYIEMQVTLDESHDMFFEFQTFEDVIQLAKTLSSSLVVESTLYSFENRFYILVDHASQEEIDLNDLIAIFAEFGSPSTTTKYRVHEYGKLLMEHNALSNIRTIF
ncbi:genetic competence negative regulator [Priestia koreensis]|uniref:Adapter protein MecA n=1 Tax=Priestia koreensis TaxID=284581 RepID=A0A0M0KZN8_9BACI|nr:genetic competence negative regulator [Priestia koreensis]KOO44072.1 adaptor protein [Priestia koreensis]